MQDELWWCSFADAERFRGLVIIPREQAEDIVALARRLWMLGLNPGGSLFATATTREEAEDSSEAWVFDPDNQGRLIDAAEMARRGYVSRAELNPPDFDWESFEAFSEKQTIDQEET